MIRIGKVLFALHSGLDAMQLPCQKSRQIDGPIIPQNSRGAAILWDDLKNTLKLKKAKPSALKVAADSCCGNKPYSSAVSQCCLGRVIPLSSVCCLNGKSVNQNNLCQCSAPSQKWTKIEAERLAKLAQVVHSLTSSIGATISEHEERLKKLNQQLFDLDQNGVHLMDIFYKLIGVERGDPEAAAIEKSLVTVRQQRRRIRRNYRFIEEYIPPEYAYDYESEYEYNYEAEPGYEMYADFVPEYDDIEYEAEVEPDEDEINLEKAKINIEERRKIREQMQTLGLEQNNVQSDLEILRSLSISLQASKAPIDNLESAARQAEILSTLPRVQNCHMTDWDSQVQSLIDNVFTAYDNSTVYIAEPISAGELRKVQYFHENYKRENSDYTDEENAEFFNYE